MGSYSVKYQDKKVKNTILEGDMAEVRTFDLPMANCRWFSDFDDEHHSPVVVVCYETQHELFGDQDPLGKEINIEGRLFEVIGTVTKIKSVFGGGKDPNDNRVILPLKTFKTLHPEMKQHVISVKATSHDDMPKGDGRDSGIAAAPRRVAFDKPDNFAVMTSDSIGRLGHLIVEFPMRRSWENQEVWPSARAVERDARWCRECRWRRRARRGSRSVRRWPGAWRDC